MDLGVILFLALLARLLHAHLWSRISKHRRA
jgi:hypothetical protein